ncbi:MAG: 1-deoxy-D-xylulose-5-phosphate reductoisomerase [Spirochaetaceae bacterium]|nr:1-deoxy-D-xylulose-5-phosphate reductoisomerase [Spirochaetaceae bacterium]
MKKKVLVLGCTGSIGTSTLDIIRDFPDLFSVAGILAHNSEEKIKALSKEFGGVNFFLTKNSTTTQLEEFIINSQADIVVNGISTSAGLFPSVVALKAGMDLALANKETIVMAGKIIKKIAKENNANILPVDSEHSAVFSLINRYGKDSVKEIILTDSGGPFREFPTEKLNNVTPSDALKHPTWQMGQKITIDSATLANKGLEVIEACQLFDVTTEQVKVVVHPQSLVHSLIKTNDGVLYAQVSPPDMKHPILTALTWPNFVCNKLEELDITAGCQLSFFPPRYQDFPMLSLAYHAAKNHGAYSIAFNAANEVAVPAFLNGQISFCGISNLTKDVLDENWTENPVTIEDVFLFDNKARQLAKSLLEKKPEAYS